TTLRMLDAFKYQHCRALAHNAPIAAKVERFAGFGGVAIPGGDGIQFTKRGKVSDVEHAVTATGKHDVGIATRDYPRRLPNRLGPCGAQADDSQVWSHCSITHRKVRRRDGGALLEEVDWIHIASEKSGNRSV